MSITRKTTLVTGLTVAAALTAGQAANAAVTDDLLAHYGFEEGSGTSVGDASSSGGPTGTVNGGASFVSGFIGDWALNFDGTDDYVNLGDWPNSGGDALSLSAWIKPNGDQDTHTALLNKYNLDDEREFRLGFHNTKNELGGDVASDPTDGKSAVSVRDGTVLADAQWAHVSMTFDGGDGTTDSGHLRLYLNGVLVDETLFDQHSFNANGNLFIGAEDRTGDPIRRFFNGDMDDIGVWSASKSSQEVAALHGLGLFHALDLEDTGHDDLLAAFGSQNSTNIDGTDWFYTTGLSGDLGATGGSLGGNDAFIVLDDSGNGMSVIPEPASLALLGLGGLAMLGRRRRTA